ncbi:unnamed protein product, partial [Adineta ricciae]
IKHHPNVVEAFHHDLYDLRHKQKRRILHRLQQQNLISYPSYSTNAILYKTPYKSNQQPRHVYHCSQRHQSTTRTYSYDQYQQSIKPNLTSSMSLSSYILDQLISIDYNEPIRKNLQVVPKQAHTLQILQTNPICSFMSGDYPNRKPIADLDDRYQSNKIDVATQWSVQVLTPTLPSDKQQLVNFNYENEGKNFNLHLTRTNSNILTELTPSIATVPTHHSSSSTATVKNDSIIPNNLTNQEPNSENTPLIHPNKSRFTKSMTERLLTTLQLPTCKCSTIETKPKHKESPLDPPSTTQRIKQLAKKCATKRSYPLTSRLNQAVKRQCRHTQANDRLRDTIQRLDRNDDSSFDFFDIDTTFTDAYDRLFTDLTTSAK